MAKSSARIRKGTAADTEPLYPLYKILRPKDTVSQEDFARLLGAVLEEHTELWIAEGSDRPVGFLTLRFGTTLHGRHSATIEELIVDPKARRGGIGRALVEKAIERAHANGCWSLELATYEENAAQKAFYGKFGFESSSTFYRLKI
jgi:ribosomal protein S18 acetylase RimI-like enzyme